jgi:glycosyltransferase involved in cell wall biosynthesis
VTRILWFGDAAQTGFGTVTWDLVTRLLAQGDDVRLLSQNQTADPIPHPLGERTWDVSRGVDFPGIVANGFRDGWKPETCVILGDFFAVRGYVLGTGPQVTQSFASIPSFHYCPVEGIDLPPAWKQVWDIVKPIAMSEFGADQIEKVTGVRPPMVYHGVNTDDFFPVAPNRPGKAKGKVIVTKDGAKSVFGYPSDRVMVLRTDRHMPRKMQNRLIAAMVPVFDAVPNADLVLHCSPIDQGGVLRDTISKLSPEHAARVMFTNAHDTFRGLDRNALNVLYNAADIYASIGAEGFGLTIAEAIACGTPAVAMDYSAVPEVVGPAGVLIPPAYLVDNEYDHKWAAIDSDLFTEAVIRLAQKPAVRRQLGSLGPAHVKANFDWDHSAAQFHDILAAATKQEAAA